jgi:hypothetical protein
MLAEEVKRLQFETERDDPSRWALENAMQPLLHIYE